MKKVHPTQKKKLKKQLKSYATVAASVLASSASSQVIYTDIKDTTLVNNGDFFDIDFNTDGINDLKISLSRTAYTSVYGSVSIYIKVDSAKVSGLYSAEVGASFFTSTYASVYEVTAFNNNQSVNNSNSFNTSGYLGGSALISYGTAPSYFNIGQFPGQGSKFVGARFNIGTNVHYGWVRLDVSSASDSVTIFDFAYDTTANAPIIAGDTGVSVGISELDAEKINMYANDAILMFPESINKNSEYRVYDLKGQLQERGRIAAGESQHNLKQSYNGVYIVEISNGEGTFRKKLWLESR